MSADKSDVIKIPAQYEFASDHGYLAAHIELTETFENLFDEHGGTKQKSFAEKVSGDDEHELLHQACEDAARAVLLNDETIKEVKTANVKAFIEERVAMFKENPELAAASRALAVH